MLLISTTLHGMFLLAHSSKKDFEVGEGFSVPERIKISTESEPSDSLRKDSKFKT
jgi:hypothetical protein